MSPATIKRLQDMRNECAPVAALCDVLIDPTAPLTSKDEHDILNCIGGVVMLLRETAPSLKIYGPIN